MFIFVEEPKSDVIKRVATFMYGNYVRMSDGVECYNACNGMHRRYVDMSQKAWNHVWENDDYEYQRHKAPYYSMVKKCYAWIKGEGVGSV